MDIKLRERFEREKQLELWPNKRVPVGGTKVEPQRAEIINGVGNVATFTFNGSEMELHALMSTPGHVRFGTFYFPGWTALVDGEPREVSPEMRTGLITLRLSEGVHHIILRFGPTPLRRKSAIASAVSGVIVLLLLIAGGRRSR